MATPENEINKNQQRRIAYHSPSQHHTPIRRALKSSNNNVKTFLDSLEALNKMNEKMKNLSFKISEESEDKENHKNNLQND